MRRTFSADPGEIREAQRTEAMIDRTEDDVSVAGDILAVVAVLFDAVAPCEAAAVQPDEDRAAFAVESRRPDVQAQAVLAHAVVVPMIDEHRVGLRTAVVETLGSRIAEGHGRADAFPRSGRLRRHEAVFSRSRRAVGNAPEIVDSAQDETAHLAVAGRSDGDLFADEELLVVGLGGGRCGRSGMRARK